MKVFANSFVGVLMKASWAIYPTADTAAAKEAATSQAQDHLGLLLDDVFVTYPPRIYRFDESLRFFHRIVAGTSAELDRCMSRLILLIPFYSIEAWVYQNITRGRALCSRHHGERHLQQFDNWERDRAAIDEIVKPKEVGCLQSKFNRELAESTFPHQAAYDARTSFQAAVEEFAACDDLRDALRATWQPPDTQLEPG